MAVAFFLSTGVALALDISGTQGNDTLRGTRQADQIYGLNGSDTIYGYVGGDELYGGAGSDTLYGLKGVDEVYGGSGQDNLFGGLNSDYLNSADDGVPDFIDCGPNDGAVDRVVRDPNDATRNCAGDTVTSPAP